MNKKIQNDLNIFSMKVITITNKFVICKFFCISDRFRAKNQLEGFFGATRSAKHLNNRDVGGGGGGGRIVVQSSHLYQMKATND